MIVYGIKNCNTVKKALDWLSEHHIDYQFHDFKKLGVTENKLAEWAEKVGYEILLNKRGTTWKQLDAATQASITSKEAAFELMQQKTSVIKRPVIEYDKGVLIGFDEKAYENKLL